MELFRALASLLEPPGPETGVVAALLDLGTAPDESDYSDLFLFQLYPYASVYLGESGGVGGEARDRIAGFWRALGRTPPPEPDHLATLLAGYARLVEAEEGASDGDRVAAWRRARHACLWEHVLSWTPPFLSKLYEIGPPFYRAWGELLEAALAQEAADLGAPACVPLALRAPPPVPDPRVEGASEFLAALLSPARSGMVLTRADLARAARDLGLGLRIGERAFILRAMFGQGPRRTLAWLETEARDWIDRHERRGSVAPPIADHWIDQAAETAALLAALTADLGASEPSAAASGDPAGASGDAEARNGAGERLRIGVPAGPAARDAELGPRSFHDEREP